MITDTYRIAERTISVSSVYPDVHAYCADYRAEGEPDFAVSVKPADLEYERNMLARTDEAEGRTGRQYTEPFLEELAVYRQIADHMICYDTVLFHGSAVAVDGACYLFIAKSGTGKSTHTALWRQMLGSRAVMVNDDKPLLKITEQGVTVFGTPYNGVHRLSTNIAVPLKALCILTRSETNQIMPVTGREAYPMLLQQVYRPADPVRMMQTVRLIDRLVKQTAFYRLGCNMEPEAAETAYRGMNAVSPAD